MDDKPCADLFRQTDPDVALFSASAEECALSAELSDEVVVVPAQEIIYRTRGRG